MIPIQVIDGVPWVVAESLGSCCTTRELLKRRGSEIPGLRRQVHLGARDFADPCSRVYNLLLHDRWIARRILIEMALFLGPRRAPLSLAARCCYRVFPPPPPLDGGLPLAPMYVLLGPPDIADRPSFTPSFASGGSAWKRMMT